MEDSHYRYSLRWKSHTYTFVNFLDHFRKQDLFCDATISCEGQNYSVHKVVLSACSNFFATVFASADCQNPVVVLQDVDRTQLESLLSYMYRGEVRVPQPELPQFIELAESLQVKGLAIPTPDSFLSSRNVYGPWHNGSLCGPPEKRARPNEAIGDAPVPLPPPPPYTYKEPHPTLACQDVHMNHTEARVPLNMIPADRIPNLHHNDPKRPNMFHSERRIPHMKHSDHSISRSYEKEQLRHFQNEHHKFRQQDYMQMNKSHDANWRNDTPVAHKEWLLAPREGFPRSSIDPNCPSVPTNEGPADRGSSPASSFSVPGDRKAVPTSKFSVPADRVISPPSRVGVPENREATTPVSRFSHPADMELSPMSRFSDTIDRESPSRLNHPSDRNLSPTSRLSHPAEKETPPEFKTSSSPSHGTFQNLVISEEPQKIKDEPEDVLDEYATDQGILQDTGLNQHHQGGDVNQNDCLQKPVSENSYSLSIPDVEGYSLKIMDGDGYTFEWVGKNGLTQSEVEKNSRALSSSDDKEFQKQVEDETTDTAMKSVEEKGYRFPSPHYKSTPDQHQVDMDCQDSSCSSVDSGLVLKDSVRTPPPPSSHSHLTNGNSQLRRELLRPLQHKPTNLTQLPPLASLKSASKEPPQLPQSIPHPVISAPPMVDRSRREPPPLMKIPSEFPHMMNESVPLKMLPHETNDSSSQNNDSNHLHRGHLLVKAPPSYHSCPPLPPPNSLPLSLNAKKDHPLMVNGRIPPTEVLQGIQGNDMTLPQNDYPVNLISPKKSSVDQQKNGEDPFLGKILTNRKRRLRGPKSWEYLVRLLKDPTTNPYLIRWENEAKGVFRLVQPAIIAQKWGRRTGKHASECLSYENFARGLRYHYATGALQPVSERSFVYKFGPKALKTLQESDAIPKLRVPAPIGRLPKFYEQQQKQQQKQQHQGFGVIAKGHNDEIPFTISYQLPFPSEALMVKTSATEAFQPVTDTTTCTSPGSIGEVTTTSLTNFSPVYENTRVPESPTETLAKKTSSSNIESNSCPSITSHDE